MRSCEVSGCGREHLARGLCGGHYARARRGVGVGVATLRPRRTSGRGCGIDGCDRRHHANGLCEMHDRRQREHGDTGKPEHYRWTGDAATYNAVHIRLAADRGAAVEQACVDCGEQASDWSYNWTADEAQRDEHGWVYCTDLSHYSPRCKTCHRRLDARHTRTRGCVVAACDRAHKARGMCNRHYRQVLRGVVE